MKVNMTFFLRMSLKSLHIHVNIDEKIIYIKGI